MVNYEFLVKELVKYEKETPWVEFKEKYGEISGTPSFLFVEKGKVVSTLQWQENKPQLTVRDMNEWLDSNLAS